MRGILPNIYALFYISNMEHPYGIDKLIFVIFNILIASFNNIYIIYKLKRLNEMKNNPTLFEEKIKFFTKKYAGPEKEDIVYTSWDFSFP